MIVFNDDDDNGDVNDDDNNDAKLEVSVYLLAFCMIIMTSCVTLD